MKSTEVDLSPGVEAGRPQSDSHTNHLRGILCVVVSIVFFSLMDSIFKWLAPHYAVFEIAFVRNVIALLLVLAYLLRGRRWRALGTRRLPAQLGRSVLSMGAMCLYVLALRDMELADAIAVSFAWPLFITALSVPLLGERVGAHRWGAVAVGFIGVLIMVRPGSGVFGVSALYVLGGALCHSLTLIAARALSRTETLAAIIVYNLIGGVALSGIALLVGVFVRWPDLTWMNPTGDHWLLFVALGVLTAFGHFALTQAYRLAPVAVLAPFEYTAIIWAVILGYLIWSQFPDNYVIVGVCVVIASGLYIVHRETIRRRVPATPPAKGEA